MLATLKMQKQMQQNNEPTVSIVNEVDPDFDINQAKASSDLADVKHKDFHGKYMRFLAYNDQNLQMLVKKRKIEQQEN
jgi:hypothetical protein